MKLIIIIFFLFNYLTASAQPAYKPFVPGYYYVNDRVSSNGNIWLSLRAGNRSALPASNSYWRNVSNEYVLAPVLTIDSLHKMIIRLDERLKLFEVQKRGTNAGYNVIFDSGDKLMNYDSINKRITW